ncbi:MAG: hypothetical protein V1701_02685 [Planctomycetota bacterium]
MSKKEHEKKYDFGYSDSPDYRKGHERIFGRNKPKPHIRYAQCKQIAQITQKDADKRRKKGVDNGR